MLRSLILLTVVAIGLLCVTVNPSSAQTEPTVEHPLAPILKDAAEALLRIEREYPGYSCKLIKRERIDGRLFPAAQLHLKVRHKKVVDGKVELPFSVYVRFEKGRQKGREIIYVDGQNDGRMLVRNGGRRMASLTVSMDPSGPLAMTGSRYPITTVGIEQLIRRLVSIGNQEMQWDECFVKKIPNLTINGRKCTLIEVTHPKPRPHFQYHIARIYQDEELELPIGFEAYSWPAQEGARPPLLEQYTYFDLRFEVPTDHDFDASNEAYAFYRRRPKQPPSLSSPADPTQSEAVAAAPEALADDVVIPVTGVPAARPQLDEKPASND